MSRKKLDPSEAELRESALKSFREILTIPTEEEANSGEWVSIFQLVKEMKLSRDSISKRLDRKVESGEVEMKKEKCLVNGKVCTINFYRIVHEITRPY